MVKQIYLLFRRSMKTVVKVPNQRIGTDDHENKDDPPGRNDIDNSKLQMGFVNPAVSMEMDNDNVYTKL